MASAKATQATKIGEFGSPNIRVPDLYDIERGNDSLPESVLEYLLFEQIGGQELLSVSRTDTLNGTNPSYSIISNLVDLRFQYAPSNIISLPNALPDIFKQYSIVLERYVPEVSIAEGDSPNAYINTDSENSLVLEFKNMQPNQQVELQILSTGDLDLIDFA